ncbi:hypothetical protein M378DRAFT_878534 [Amanita muscaria Koide BX008]|uniref:Uncharacterized protein n=1 Tax=Amanita muscaria (strain Koide BX008) TaxID=946122 RepID=A0A0C2X2N5_AMAMK|nr:hypothetical protein M378DRAFT_878534 [Amanita muscaria Koide BX008]
MGVQQSRSQEDDGTQPQQRSKLQQISELLPPTLRLHRDRWSGSSKSASHEVDIQQRRNEDLPENNDDAATSVHNSTVSFPLNCIPVSVLCACGCA